MAVGKKCIWREQSTSEYSTSCGATFIFSAGGIRENGFVFCPYCGKQIKAIDVALLYEALQKLRELDKKLAEEIEDLIT